MKFKRGLWLAKTSPPFREQIRILSRLCIVRALRNRGIPLEDIYERTPAGSSHHCCADPVSTKGLRVPDAEMHPYPGEYNPKRKINYKNWPYNAKRQPQAAPSDAGG